MSITGFMHWEEGLFLQPHHLQSLQRQLFEQSADERRLLQPFPYGVVESEHSTDQLKTMLLRFDRLRAVMPSGVYVRAPGNTDLPSLDITKKFKASNAPITVYLGVPVWYAARANTIEGGEQGDMRVKQMYRVTDIERMDENTGENPQPVRVRRLNARLLLDGDDQTDLEVLPLMRIVHAEGQEVGLPRLDTNFVPPCLTLHGSTVLTNLVRDIKNAVEASRTALVVQITRGGFSIDTIRGRQFEQLLRLKSISRYAASLPLLVDSEGIPTWTLYQELRGLLAELGALYPDRDPTRVPDYDHDEPLVAFSELSARIRPLLQGVSAPSFIKVDLPKDGDVFAAELTDEHLTRPNAYFLGIKTKEDPVALARLVTDADKFKLMPRSLSGRAIRGVKLIEERHAPVELPAEVDLHYFRLDPQDNKRVWERVVSEHSITAQWPNCEVSDDRVTLYMTVPNA